MKRIGFVAAFGLHFGSQNVGNHAIGVTQRDQRSVGELRWTPMFGQPKGLFKVQEIGLAARETPPRSRAYAGTREDSQETTQAPTDIGAYANSCDSLRVPAKYISGEDRIRTCGGLAPSRI